jgi:hypothetical protein
MNNTTNAHQQICETGFLERPRYFARQLLTPAEMTLEQTYFRDKMRRHNRFLHGWGVVCGAIVCVVPKQDGNGAEPWKIHVSSGYLLGPYGDEIVIDTGRVVDLRTPGASGTTGANPVEQTDPWCSPVFVERKGGPLFVAVKYKEVMCRPVRTQPNGCGCDDSQCEYSRLRDGYEIGVLDACPDDHTDPPSLDDFNQGGNPACPPCPPEPWVVLAEVQMDADGSILAIDNCSCRRIVLSFAGVWRECVDGAVVIEGVDPAEVTQGQKDAEVVIRGRNLDPQVQFKMGGGLTEKSRTPAADGTSLTLKLDVDERAALGPRTIIATNPNGVCGLRRDALKVLPKGGTTDAAIRPLPPPAPAPAPPTSPPSVAPPPAALASPSEGAAGRRRTRKAEVKGE